jgi:hypothetical protein
MTGMFDYKPASKTIAGFSLMEGRYKSLVLLNLFNTFYLPKLVLNYF